jgi:hypothetical protein
LTHRLAIPVAFGLAACGEEPRVAVLPPDDVELHWDEAFNAEDDGLAGLVTVDVMVYEALTGDPVEGVAVVLDSERAGLVRPEAVIAAEDACADDMPCAGLVWDAWRDEYLVIEGFDPDRPVTLFTDADGIGRATVYVDAFPVEDGGFGPVEISVDVAGAEARAVFSLIPQ